LSFADDQGAGYTEGWIGKWDMEGAKWMHVGGITDQGARRLMLAADRTHITGNLGIRTSNPVAALQVRNATINNGGASFFNDVSALFVCREDNGGNSTKPPETVMVLAREGINEQSYAHFTRFDLGSYGVKQAQLDIRLGEGSNTPIIMSLRSNRTVGIGTNDPQTSLHIKGNGGVVNLEGSDHAYMQWYPAGYTGGRKGRIGYASANDKNLMIHNEYADGYVSLLSGGGRVGINVPDPQGPLDVKGDSYFRGGLWFANEQGRVYADGWIGKWQGQPGDPLWLHIGGITDQGARRLLLAASITTIGGNVGIGTADPKVPLHIKGNTGVLNLEGSDHAYMQWYPAGYSNTGRKGWIGYGSANEKNLTIKNEYADGHLNLISASGKVGIGTNSPASTLHIRRDVSGGLGPTLLLHNAGGVQNAEANIDVQTYAQDVGPNFRLRVIDNGNFGAHVDFSTKPTGNQGNYPLASRLYISADGNIGIGTNAPGARLQVGSDRLKFSVGEAETAEL